MNHGLPTKKVDIQALGIRAGKEYIGRDNRAYKLTKKNNRYYWRLCRGRYSSNPDGSKNYQGPSYKPLSKLQNRRKRCKSYGSIRRYSSGLGSVPIISSSSVPIIPSSSVPIIPSSGPIAAVSVTPRHLGGIVSSCDINCGRKISGLENMNNVIKKELKEVNQILKDCNSKIRDLESKYSDGQAVNSKLMEELVAKKQELTGQIIGGEKLLGENKRLLEQLGKQKEDCKKSIQRIKKLAEAEKHLYNIELRQQRKDKEKINKDNEQLNKDNEKLNKEADIIANRAAELEEQLEKEQERVSHISSRMETAISSYGERIKALQEEVRKQKEQYRKKYMIDRKGKEELMKDKNTEIQILKRLLKECQEKSKVSVPPRESSLLSSSESSVNLDSIFSIFEKDERDYAGLGCYSKKDVESIKSGMTMYIKQMSRKNKDYDYTKDDTLKCMNASGGRHDSEIKIVADKTLEIDFDKYPRLSGGAVGLVYDLGDYIYKIASGNRYVVHAKAAYLLNNLLGLNLVEPVEIIYNTYNKGYGFRQKKVASNFTSGRGHWQIEVVDSEMKKCLLNNIRLLFDFLINRGDAHTGNYFCDYKTGDIRVIDYDSDFGVGIPINMRNRTIFNGELPETYSPSIKSKVNGLTYDKVYRTFENYLSETQINSLWLRLLIVKADMAKK